MTDTAYNPRTAPRLIMTAALDDDMPTAVDLIGDLATHPDIAAEAMLNFGELLNLTLAALARATDRTTQEAWQEIAVDHAANDDTWDAEKGAQFIAPPDDPPAANDRPVCCGTTHQWCMSLAPAQCCPHCRHF